eukprot:SAG22_NODE_13559_length_402_cov_1.003300_2_plen_24_part_01
MGLGCAIVPAGLVGWSAGRKESEL